jgi:hypothetical protein
MIGERFRIEPGKPPQGVGVKHRGPGELSPQPADEGGGRLGTAEAGTDGEGIGPASERGECVEGVVGKRAVGPGRERMGHDAGIEPGGDRRRTFGSGQIHKSSPAPEGRHRRQSRGPGHAGRPSHHEHPAVVTFARIPLSDGQSGEIDRRGKRLAGWGGHRGSAGKRGGREEVER